jgi:membrane associated rhomboid family serine protease
MPRIGAAPFAFPDFRGATRRLVLANLIAYFALYLAGFAAPALANQVGQLLAFVPTDLLHGAVWQPITYSLVHFGLVGTLF